MHNDRMPDKLHYAGQEYTLPEDFDVNTLGDMIREARELAVTQRHPLALLTLPLAGNASLTLPVNEGSQFAIVHYGGAQSSDGW